MARRLILDTNILIDYERGLLDRSLFDFDDIAIAAITVAEYRIGIERAPSVEKAAQRARALAAIVSVVEVLDYTQRTAAVHARLIAHVRTVGQSRGAHDLIIAAHAVESERMIISRDARAKFGSLPGVIAALPG